MTPLSKVLQISVFGLACLSSMMMALAEGAVMPQGLTLPLALLAFFFTDYWKRYRLGITWANVLGVAALGYTCFQLFDVIESIVSGLGLPEEGISSEILDAGHLLVFLSWILFFQEKTPRHYWSLFVLSVLQVAVGAVLNSSGWYGVLLFGYVFAAVWSLSIFSLEQARLQFVWNQTDANKGMAAEPALPVAGGVLAAAMVGGPSVSMIDPAFQFRQASTTKASVQLDANTRWISPRFVLGIMGTTCLAISIAILFVIFTPRIWVSQRALFSQPRNEHGSALVGITGFTESVTLGRSLSLSQSSEPVLELKLIDAKGNSLDVDQFAQMLGHSEPMFRGAVMPVYENHGWSAAEKADDYHAVVERALRGAIQQQIRLQPIGTDILFAMYPIDALHIDFPQSIAVAHARTGVIRRSQTPGGRGLVEYTAYTLMSRRNNTGNLVRSGNWLLPELLGRRGRRSFRQRGLRLRRAKSDDSIYLQLPKTGLEELRATARRVAYAESGGTRPSNSVMARRLESYLRDSGRFEYSLELSVDDDTIDPVEDFIKNRKSGHCEYFASALALMLREVDIPSRLVSGYKGGQTNKFSGYFQVEQRHAHAWVEALIDRRWVTFDPTPFDERSRSVASMAARMLTWQDFKQFVEGFWSDFVVHADINRQYARIYGPAKDAVVRWWIALKSDRSWVSNSLKSVASFLTSPKKWLSWQGGLVAASLPVLGFLLVWLARRFSKFRLRLPSRRGRRNVASLSQIAFYERFRKLCRSRGLIRRADQTHREFAETVHHSWDDLLRASGLSTVPRHLVDVFYHVRFGSRQLDRSDTKHLDQELTRLEAAFKKKVK